jgi:hypothetical protein
MLQGVLARGSHSGLLHHTSVKEMTQYCQLKVSRAEIHFLLLNAFICSKSFAIFFAQIYFKFLKV